jgi:hypothetical protein
MIDYKVIYKEYTGNIEETFITIEDDINIDDDFERGEIIRETLEEKIKEFGGYQLIDFEELFICCDLYKISYEDRYVDTENSDINMHYLGKKYI